MSSEIDMPAWVQDAVFYQIFPDRFARSGRVTVPSRLLAWSDLPTLHGYHGGDLWGIIQHLDHLTDLGINAIYLNPIFQSASNHRYHTHDYEKVDPLLGGNEALRTLVDQAHNRSIRIILDGVFNHASRGFFPFNDILENGVNSPWLDWFQIQGWPLAPYDDQRPSNYSGWWGHRELPRLNTDNPEVREYIMGIGERWVRDFDIDGWRLDVPEEITADGFWEEFRRRVRAIKADAYLVGEIWHHAPQWLRGDRFDAVMNYPFAEATIAFTAGDRVSATLARDRSYNPYPGIDATEYARRIEEQLQWYDWNVTKVQLNLLGSHDTPRVISLAHGDRATVRLATLLQMTMPGSPCVYYGDEIALQGAVDCDGPHHDYEARRTFPWHDRGLWDAEMLAHFRDAIALRHAHPVLRHGQYQTAHAQDRCFACLRWDDSERLLVVINAGDKTTDIEVPAANDSTSEVLPSLLFGQGTCRSASPDSLTVNLPPRTGAVFAV